MSDKKPGQYLAHVVETSVGKLGTNNNDALVILCQLIEHTDTVTGFKTQVPGNELARVVVWLTANTLTNQVTKDQCSVFGEFPDVLDPLADNKFVGKELNLWCKLKPSPKTGEEFPEFSISTPGRGMGNNLSAKASKDDIRKLMALCGGPTKAAQAEEAPPEVVAENF